jgi:dTDP-4-dehydrorhamnose reductase/dTDP-4-dehydrorhamnose 3,5-epimerase
MKKIKTNLEDCYILEPQRFGDERGYFESVTREQLKELGFNEVFQVSNSLSSKGIVRGLHFQKDQYCQAKVVRCHRGAVLDVVVDARKDSKTYGQWTSVELTPENGRLLFVPRGFAHGFVALKDDSLFEYYVDNQYMPRLEGGILWNDPALGIDWGIENPVLSDKDKNRCTLAESDVEFTRAHKKFFITGASGQLGYDIIRELNARGEYDIYAPDSKELDITDRDQVLAAIKKYNPDVIFHCAAWTAVDCAEQDQDICRKVNVDGTKNLVDAAKAVDAKILYMSTDYVFDGTKDGLYTEDDQPNPKSVYGQTKYDGEEAVRSYGKHFITRISWVFCINGNNFIKTMLSLADTHDELTVVNDQVGSPTYTVDLAKMLVEMSFTDKYGTYNVNNEGFCSWAEFAEYIMKAGGKKTKIKPVTTEEYYKGKDMSTIAYRPKNSKLDKTKLAENFALLPTWQDAVDRYVKELEKK